MKRWLTSAVAFGAIVTGASTAMATSYPPPTDAVVATPRVVATGGTVEVDAPCAVGDTVLVRLGEHVETASCVSDDAGLSDGGASRTTIKIEAPGFAGDHRGVAEGSTSGDIGSFFVQVVDFEAAADETGSAQLIGTLGIDWVTVARSTTIGVMTMLMMAAAVLAHRRITVD